MKGRCRTGCRRWCWLLDDAFWEVVDSEEGDSPEDPEEDDGVKWSFGGGVVGESEGEDEGGDGQEPLRDEEDASTKANEL